MNEYRPVSRIKRYLTFASRACHACKRSDSFSTSTFDLRFQYGPSTIIPIRNGIIIATLLLNVAAAADWPQWRGPNRDGVVPEQDGIRLASTWPEGGPKRVWQSEPIPGGNNNAGGYGSVAIADGRAYLYVNWQGIASLPSRILTTDSLRSLGWSEDMALPADVEAKVEAARISSERIKLDKKVVTRWVNEWVERHLTIKERRAFGSHVRHRLRIGDSALAPDRLKELVSLRDQFFATEADLAQSLKALGWPSQLRAKVLQASTGEYDARDVIICLDCADGKTLWRVEYPGIQYDKAGTSSTPAVVDGRCYVMGGNGFVYCLDAESGRTIWMTNPNGDTEPEISSSVIVVENRVVGMCVPLTAFDAQTGQVLWRQPSLRGRNNSAAVWSVKGKNYFLCNDKPSGKVACVDPKDGRVVWTVEGGGTSTVVVSGDIMVVFSADKQAHLSAVQLSVTHPKVLWRHEHFAGRGESPVVYGGHVYIFGMEGRAACVELITGKIRWKVDVDDRGGVSSPIVLDGKIVIPYAWGTKLVLIQATPSKYTVLAQAVMPLSTAASPAFADRRLFLRMANSVACYDICRP